jgi:hypothetical protein
MVPAARKNHFLGWCLFVLPKTSQRGISMSGIVPTLGWIVWFYARRYQAEQINKRRADAARELDYHRWKKNGAMINVGNPVDAGQIVPARIVNHGRRSRSRRKISLDAVGQAAKAAASSV